MAKRLALGTRGGLRTLGAWNLDYRAVGLMPWCLLSCLQPSTERPSQRGGSGQRSGTEPGVTFQEPTDLLREGDGLHLARREVAAAEGGTRDTRPALTAAGRRRRAAPRAPVPRLRLGAQRRAEPPAARSGSGARSGRREPDPGRRCTDGTEVASKVKGVAL